MPLADQPAVAPASAAWVEPTSQLPLRWGRYPMRRNLGIMGIVTGIAVVQGTSTYSLNFGLVGSLLLSAGWIVLPSEGWRRIVVIFPTLVIAWLLLGRSEFSGLFAGFLAAWLLVRQRPVLSYLAVLLPIVSGYLIGRSLTGYSVGWAALAISAAVTVAAAWIARAIARQRWSRRHTRTSQQDAETHETTSGSAGDLD